MLLTIITFILVLSVLVFVHEFGHFIAAKKMGVKVEEFGFGFPPRLWGIRKGETVYSINLIPFGGFVKLKGLEDNEANFDSDSFASKKIWQRALILASGVLMNFILAIVLISVGFTVGVPQSMEEAPLPKFARVRDENIQITSVLENSPANKASFQEGDIIKKIDNYEFSKVEDIQNYIDHKNEKALSVEIKRGDELITKNITAIKLEDNKAESSGEHYIMGVGLVKVGTVSYPLYLAFYKGFEATIIITNEIFIAFGDLFKSLVTSHKVSVEFTGPIGIAALTGKMAKLGLIYVLEFMALLSINLAILNFLPFPALDGGRILFIVIEKIRGKAVNQNLENLIHNIGFALLMVLVMAVTYKDILNYKSFFINIFTTIKKMF